ncbi:hypothetical protein GCM10027169_17110 [Gordonia jinhuaensis]|uniref:site-specific DNA-methyltransferase (adenine-specific) n=2 Tax=Gordonia jinhuaensis TaxID=1517702 RepID=A0A916X0M3_9ACTN|nr:hypothetical protein GCM10011489_38640 [Gordonia jinhuaensis]
MLIGALAVALGRESSSEARRFVAESACAADLSPTAIRATRLTLTSALTDDDDIGPLRRLDERLLVGDSLLRPAEDWTRIAPEGFGAVIANPPWDKLKVTRHDALVATGVARHYGAGYDSLPDEYAKERAEMVRYLDSVSFAATRQGTGESDLYKLFLDLSARLVGPGGQLALLVPAGLIRSQGTQALREFLIDEAANLAFTVHDNRARYFAIDTRFKFLTVHASIEPGVKKTPIRLAYGVGDAKSVSETDSVFLGRSSLRRMRPDLTIPEVRGVDGWKLFQRMSAAGVTLQDGAWTHTYSREVDMTNDRAKFDTGDAGGLPVLEGRMLHQFRARAKAYANGTGRAATWEPLPLGRGRISPQFTIAADKLRKGIRTRCAELRAGFCDVTGQTNERTLLASVVPPDVVCGNKVPTLTMRFTGLSPDDSAYLWVAVANSLPVDWLVRRIVTTSMNYFLLASVPLPRMDAEDPQTRSLIDNARILTDAEQQATLTGQQIAERRAAIDCIVAEFFGLSVDDLELVMDDFPLLDRGQPPLPGESRSTVTRDLLLARASRRSHGGEGSWHARAEAAQELGAVAYVPADYA